MYENGTSSHKHQLRGDVGMKELQIGNTKIVIHSDFVNLSDSEKKQWFETEMKKGNRVLKDIEHAVNACYLD
ncbi:hypothetical protein NG54_07790 [Heyndrickxia ginsengihumi]|uniref:Uncharacterized protein n=2 Tax=Heyndrickxia ginsengihumi TaxID=363870 RepID=A0A0A6VDU8_9BACI|nr:hypothetical protein NG54_07790 [Heyndrickxia ginsengihumi]